MNTITGISAKVEEKESGVPAQTHTTAVARWFPHVEAFLVFALALTAFSIHLLHINVPNITLVFDSTGYLAVTNSWLALLQPEFFSAVGTYIVHGFQNSDRVLLVEQMGAAREVLKTGPLLPLILVGAYKLTNLPALSQHWQAGAMAMITVQSLTVTLMWSIARQYWGTAAARIAVLLALSYTGLVINSGRLMSEIPAACAITFAAWTLLKVTRPPGNPVRAGLLLGTSLALLMVARSVLVLLPVILLPLIFFVARKDKSASAETVRGKLFSPKFLAGAAVSALIVLAPWALCEQILTGHPSIMIDRYGAYNLFTGLDVNNDALDVLPSPLVSHPEQYKPKASQALKNAADHAIHAPMQFLDMVLRKPARLADSPWSDFQASCWRMPWLFQVWWHQFLMMLGALGLLQALRQAIKSDSADKKIAPMVLGTIVLYHLINCAFITMRRYMFTATPEVLILAAAGLVLAWKNSSRTKFFLLIAATAALPTVNLLISLSQQAPHDWLAQAAAAIGVLAIRSFGTIAVSTIAIAWFWFVSSKNDNRWLRTGWGAAAIVTTAVCIANTWHILGNLEGSVTLNRNNPALSVQMPGLVIHPENRYFIVVDCHAEETQSRPLKDLALIINDREIQSEFQPLFALDRNQRENFLYERVFAASAGVEADSFRQWYAAEVPANALTSTKSQTGPIIQVQNKAPVKPLFVATDFANNGLEHELSLTRFSWTKGFMINPAGEMRIDEWKQPGSGHGMVPRVYMLVVQGNNPATTSSTQSTVVQLPDTHISKATTERLFQYTLDRDKLPAFVATSTAENDGVFLRVKGRVRAPQGSAEASIGVVEYRYKDGKKVEELAPLAPSVIAANSEWRPFEFCELIPLESPELTMNTGSTAGGLESLRIIVAGHNWFDLLQYASYRPRGTVEIKDLQVEFQPIQMIDLSRKNWHRVKPMPVPDSRVH